jgi:hypothetical protein
MLVPYVAVVVGLLWLQSAWLALLAYHALIVAFDGFTFRGVFRKVPPTALLLTIPYAATGPVLYFTLPYMLTTDLSQWLAARGLAGTSLVVFIVYYALVNPILEERFWGPLRQRTPVAHAAFAGYHLLVCYTLVGWPWLIAMFAILAFASVVWEVMLERLPGLVVPIVSHLLADVGIVVVAWLYR